MGSRAEASAAAVVRDGWTILPDVIEPPLVRELVARIETLLEELSIPPGSNTFLGHHTRRIFNLLARDVLFERVPVHAAVLPVIEAVLDRECLLSSLTAIEMGPGETDQPFHADDGSIGLSKPHGPITCTAIWALTDFTRVNGATRLVPGSHRGDRNPRRGEQPPFEQAEMSAGSVLVYHGSLWHGGAANAGPSARIGMVANYCAGFLRQEECQLLALPRERVAAFTPRLRELVGYGTYRGLMGHVDQRSPAEWLDPATGTDMVWRRMR